MARTLELDTITEPGNTGTANITLSSDTTTTMPLVDINGGAIDGTTIGASTPSTVAATTLTTSGAATFGNSADDATTVTGTLAVAGAASLNGDVSIGNAVGDAITVVGTTTINAVSGCNTVVGATSGNQTIDIASHDQVDGGLKLAGTLVTASAAELNTLDGITSTVGELNVMDGGTSATGTTLADADRVVVNDGGTMKQVALTDFETYFEASLDTQPALTTVGALNSGSITSGFGTINTGSSTITTTGALAAATLDTGQGANELYDMDQNVLTTSAVTFATVNTGQGNHELYEMNQDVMTNDAVTFLNVTATSTINGIYVKEYANATYGDTYSYGDGQTMNYVANGTNQGVRNNAFGYSCLSGLQNGNDNTAMGFKVLKTSYAWQGNGNTGFGSYALETTSGDYNTGIGYVAQGPTSGDNNTIIGYQSGTGSSPSGYIGGSSNRICLGNNSVTNAYIKVDWTVTSDERDKADIVPMEHGLDVVENINPINFVWDTRTDYWDIADTRGEDGNLDITKNESDGSKKQSDNLRTGFSAQNVKSALDAIGWEGHAVVNSEDPDNLKITHTNIIPFMVNAIKELSAKVKALEAA